MRTSSNWGGRFYLKPEGIKNGKQNKPNITTLRNIIIKCQKQKREGGKREINHQIQRKKEQKLCLSSETLQARWEWNYIFTILMEKNIKPRTTMFILRVIKEILRDESDSTHSRTADVDLILCITLTLDNS